MSEEFRRSGLMKLGLVFASAMIVISIISIWTRKSSDPARSDATVGATARDWWEERRQRLRALPLERDRVEALLSMSEDVEREAVEKARSGNSDRLKELAATYKQFIEIDMLTAARILPPEERNEAMKSAAARLAKTEKAMEKLAAQMGADGTPFLAIAASAREGQERLQRLIRGEIA